MIIESEEQVMNESPRVRFHLGELERSLQKSIKGKVLAETVLDMNGNEVVSVTIENSAYNFKVRIVTDCLIESLIEGVTIGLPKSLAHHVKEKYEQKVIDEFFYIPENEEEEY